MFGSIGDWQAGAVVYPLLTFDKLVIEEVGVPLLGVGEDGNVGGTGQDQVRDRELRLLSTSG